MDKTRRMGFGLEATFATPLADLRWASLAQPPEPPLAFADDPRPDALTGLLRAAVAAQEGRCLICDTAPACYCGLYCAGHPDPTCVLTLHVCGGCGDPGVLYCSAACAARGR